MKSLCVIGTIALTCSSVLYANEVEAEENVTLSSETLSLSELLSYVDETVCQLIDADEESSHIVYEELKESLKIVYAINCLHREEAANILQALDECYASLLNAIDRNPQNANILTQSLTLFTSGRN